MARLLLKPKAEKGAISVASDQSQAAQVFFLHVVRAIVLRCP